MIHQTQQQLSRKQNQDFIDSNEVLMLQRKQVQTKIYYVPGYMRLTIQSMDVFDVEKEDAQITVYIILDIYYGILDIEIVDKLQQSLCIGVKDQKIHFNKSDQFRSSDNYFSMNYKQKTLTCSCIIKTSLQFSQESSLFWSPFQLVYLTLTLFPRIEFQSKQTFVIINLMDTDQKLQKCYMRKNISKGSYDIAGSLLDIQVSNSSHMSNIKKFLKKQKDLIEIQNQIGHEYNYFQCYRFAHLIVSMYKSPYVTLITIFLPLWTLGFINLGIFFQENSVQGRITSIATLMIAYAAFFPTVRSQIPLGSKVVIIEILVYLQILANVLTTIESLNIMNDQYFIFKWKQSGLFISVMIINIFQVTLVMILLFLHFRCWKPKFERSEDPYHPQFKRDNWKNQKCDADLVKVNTSLKARGKSCVVQLKKHKL